ncbi:aminotransferase class IV [Fulvivirga sediminis]|uniref:Aminotransferase class IV n=1 Tax=Fulvivirga sediminis TaxID=2803949 RepID=A0A937F859_9BACT|nr:aminotransferase class IV [Fulvivirga sediminis]MBL3655758.1 aminotransferase class IV [Fulvivirga sediminis]
MIALFNNKWVDNKISLNMSDRAIQFGDGLFETILYSNNTIHRIAMHLERLKQGCDAMRIKLPDFISNIIVCKSAIEKLIHRNQVQHQDLRIKIMVWRQEANQAGYSSDNTSAHTLIFVKPYSIHNIKEEISVGLSSEVKNHFWKMAPFKKLNSLPYIIASQEKDERQLDELIITNVNGNISECITSNIFWYQSGSFYTPSLNTGCVAGVRRKEFIIKLKALNYPILEVEEGIESLYNAEFAFITNSLSVKKIAKVENFKFPHSAIYESFIRKIEE